MADTAKGGPISRASAWVRSIPNFVRQVRTETGRVIWPTGGDTARTTMMVLIMTGLLALFFFAVDSFFAWVVRSLLTLL